jgi:hypothetical protein
MISLTPMEVKLCLTGLNIFLNSSRNEKHKRNGLRNFEFENEVVALIKKLNKKSDEGLTLLLLPMEVDAIFQAFDAYLAALETKKNNDKRQKLINRIILLTKKIQKYDGSKEQQKTTSAMLKSKAKQFSNKKLKLEGKMSIKEDILRMKEGIPRYALNEMAAKELNAVLSLIMADKPEEAAQKYFELGGNKRGITRTINTYLTKNPEADKVKMSAFQSAASKVADEQGIKSENKKKTTVKNKEGEEVAAGGQSGEARQKTAMKRIEKEGMASKKELDFLSNSSGKIQKEMKKLEQQLVDVDSEDVKKLKALAKEILDDISEPPLDNKEKRDIKILKDFIENGEKTQLAVDLMKDVIEAGLENLEAIYQHVGRGSKLSPDEKTAKKKEGQYKKIDALKKAKNE